jgi:hypothetical protein
VVVTVVLHVLALVAWRVCTWTKGTPLPELLVFPVPQVLLANTLALPLAIASTVLSRQADRASDRAVGAICLSLLLAYVALVVALLRGVLARRRALGLRYVERAGGAGAAVPQGQEQEKYAALVLGLHHPGKEASRPPVGEPSLQQAGPSCKPGSLPGKGSRSEKGSGGSPELRLPLHANGCWERPDHISVANESHEPHQGECGGGLGVCKLQLPAKWCWP